MGIRTFCTSLATFGAGVAGIGYGHSFDLDQMPQKIGREMLPCLILIPETGDETGFSTHTQMGSGARVNFTVKHLLLYDEADTRDAATVLPLLIDFWDAYNTAAAASPLLTVNASPINQVVMQFKTEIGVTEWPQGGIRYHSIVFTHAVTLYL